VLAQYSRQTVCGALIRGALTLVLLAIPVCGWLFGSATATAADEGEECVNAEVRKAQRAEFLPDCRAYEKVSPNAKGNTDVHGAVLESLMQASLDGDGLVYSSNGAFPGTVRNGSLPYSYRATRTTTGWESVALNPPSTSTPANCGTCSFGNTGQVVDVSPDLERAIVATNSAIDENGALVPDVDLATNLFSQDNPGSNFELLTPGAPNALEVAAQSNYYLYEEGATEDLSHVVFSTGYAMTPNAVAKSSDATNLYEYANGEVRLVSVDSDGQPLPGAVHLGRTGLMNHNVAQNAISADGSRIFFDARNAEGGRIHVRIDGEQTIQIPRSTGFYAADRAGQKALYFQSGEGIGTALKIFHVDTQTTTNVIGEGECAQCQFIAASQDLDRIYFVNRAAMLPGQDPLPAGATGLYLWEEGELRFVASVVETHNDFIGHLVDRNQRVLGINPDGSALAFVAGGEVNGVDNHGRYHAYLYDADTDELVCMSCTDGPPVADPQDRTFLWGGEAEFSGSTYTNPLHRPYTVSVDGGRVFFHTAEPLVPQDTNGRYDVYIWQDGEAQLISSGKSRYDARFVDADPAGENVFFATRAKLLASDDDEYVDIYNARVGGGFAEPDRDPPDCQGDSCQDPPLAPPPDSEPGSSEFEGPGNPTAESKDCTKLERAAAAAKRKAKRAERSAKGAKRRAAEASGKRAQRLSRQAKHLERRAKRLNDRAAKQAHRAKRCKRSAA